MGVYCKRCGRDLGWDDDDLCVNCEADEHFEQQPEDEWEPGEQIWTPNGGSYTTEKPRIKRCSATSSVNPAGET